MSDVLAIDPKKIASELAELRFLSARLNRELFDQCCQLQRDEHSVDLQRLTDVASRARVAEERKRLLEEVLVLQGKFAAVAGPTR